MTKFHIVPDEDWEVLEKYLDESGVVLLHESELVNRPLDYDEQKAIVSMNGQDIDYDFGGSADVFVDLTRAYDGDYVIDRLLEIAGF